MDQSQETTKPAGRFSLKRLAWRIMFWMALIGLGPLLIMAVQGYHCARMAVVERAEAQLRSVVQARKSSLEQWLDERKADLRLVCGILGAEADLESLSAGSLKPAAERRLNLDIFAEVRLRTPAFESFYLYNLDWKLVFWSGKDSIPHPDIFSPELKTALKETGKIYLSPVHQHQTEGMGLHVACPLASRRGVKEGYLLVYLKVSQAIDPVLEDSSGLGQGGKAYLYFHDRNLIYTPSGVRKIALDRNPQLAEVLFSGTSTILEYNDYLEKRVLGISRPIPELRASVIVDLDSAALFGWLGVLKQRALVTGVITLIVALVLAARSSWRLSRPLARLAGTARRIAAGSYEERLGPLEGLEAGEVGRAFNKMLDELEANKRRLLHAAALAAVGELSSSIAHEMRNPLSSIKINLQALRRKVETAPYRELSDIALNQVARLERMLSELLNYAKPLNLEPRAFALGELAGEIIEELKGPAGEKGISIRFENRLAPVPLTADREQLHRALSNLVRNALDAAPQGGSVCLAARLAQGDVDNVEILVSDNGPGIRPGDESRIFQPFYTTRQDGTGLGLANVKKIVEEHGGRVTVETSSPQGAVFKVLIPAGGPRP